MKYKDFKLPELPVDDSLTLENAVGRGYEYVRDVVYDCEAPYIAMKDILDLVKDKRYKLGTSPTAPADWHQINGIYKPLE